MKTICGKGVRVSAQMLYKKLQYIHNEFIMLLYTIILESNIVSRSFGALERMITSE